MLVKIDLNPSNLLIVDNSLSSQLMHGVQQSGNSKFDTFLFRLRANRCNSNTIHFTLCGNKLWTCLCAFKDRVGTNAFVLCASCLIALLRIALNCFAREEMYCSALKAVSVENISLHYQRNCAARDLPAVQMLHFSKLDFATSFFLPPPLKRFALKISKGTN